MLKRAVFLAVVLSASGVALAAPRDDADAAISKGIALRRAGNDTAALDEFLRAQKLFPSPRAAAQVGLALQALGRWGEAEAQVEEALRGQVNPWIVKNKATLDAALTTIKGHVGSLEVMGFPPGADVWVEQRRVGALPLDRPVRATAGTVALEVRAPGYLPITRNVAVAPGTLSRESVKLTPDVAEQRRVGEVAGGPAAVPADPPAAGAPSNWQVPAAWATGIGGGVLLAGGVVALVIRGDKSSQLSQRLDTGKTCTRSGNSFSGPDAATCVDLATSRDTWTWVAVGTLVGAGAAVAITGVLLATRPRGAEPESSAGLVPRVNAGAVPGLAFASAQWTF